MPSEEQLIEERRRKRKEFIDKHVNPYPHTFVPDHKAAALQDCYRKLKKEEKTEDTVTVAGRVIALRRLGKISFMTLEDETGSIQAFFSKDSLENYPDLKLYDRGDVVGVRGKVMRTKTGELSIFVEGADMLCKSLRPLPEKWHGLKDIESRYRQRYVDLIMSPEVREAFVKKSRMISSVRRLLEDREFLEVETPVLQPVYGGGAAKPFKSHLNALDMDVYLRIAPELYLKRLIVGGYPRVFEFAKCFRNEDIDRTHNPEFTNLEIYQAYADYEDMMSLTEEIYANTAKELGLGTSFEWEGNKVSLKRPWKRYTMVDAIKKFGGIGKIDIMDEKDMKELQKQHNLDLQGKPTKGKIIQELFETLVEDKLVNPTFIIQHPKESTPLCKEDRDDPRFVERFEPFCCGMEIGNGYSELNDPVKQRELLELQAEELRSGAEEAHPMDEDFVRAIEYGMPPTGGVGVGIDRMAMLLLGQPSIRDVIFFPFMKER